MYVSVGSVFLLRWTLCVVTRLYNTLNPFNNSSFLSPRLEYGPAHNPHSLVRCHRFATGFFGYRVEPHRRSRKPDRCSFVR